MVGRTFFMRDVTKRGSNGHYLRPARSRQCVAVEARACDCCAARWRRSEYFCIGNRWPSGNGSTKWSV